MMRIWIEKDLEVEGEERDMELEMDLREKMLTGLVSYRPNSGLWQVEPLALEELLGRCCMYLVETE